MAISPIEPVVVGVDGTLSSVRAVDLAAEEAGARVAPLVVVYTVEPATDPALLPDHRCLLDLVVSRAQADHPALSVDGDLVYGEPVDTLVRWSARACLVVVGHRDPARTAWSTPGGSVAAEVAARSAAPVIVYRPPDATTGGPVLIGLGGPAGEPEQPAGPVRGPARGPIAFAFEEAELRGAPILACHVQPPGQVLPGGCTGGHTVTPAESRHLLVEALDKWVARYPGVEVRQAVLSGADVAAALARASRTASLAVVGADGHRAPGLSPVTRDLIDAAHCPVAVVWG
jgi:nucleotide-binding universal stress UspA family protein